MKKFVLIIPVAVIIMCLILFAATPSDSKPRYSEKEIMDMVRDIQSLNLLNSLHLSREQNVALLKITEEVKKMDDDIQALNDRKYNEMHKILSEMRTQLMSSNDLSEDLKREFHKSEREIKEKRVAYEDRMKELNKKVKGILNANQLVMLKEYQPCLVPVKNISNPERIGQASGGERQIKLLERARKIPNDKYAEFKQIVREKTEKAVKLHIRDEKEREQAIRNMSEAMDKARKMNDTEFEINKQQLADSMIPQKKNKGENVEEKFIGRFLLNPGLTAILKQKINMAAK